MYIFTSKMGPIIKMETIEELETDYYKICNDKFIESGLAKKEFYENMNNDHFLIISIEENIFFFLDEEYINKTIEYLEETDNLFELNIIKEKNLENN